MAKLGQETGGDQDSREVEARSILKMLAEFYAQLNAKELQFVEGREDRDCRGCSGKQLFWLRDIKDKYL